MKPIVAVVVMVVVAVVPLFALPAPAAEGPEVSLERFYSLPRLVGTTPSGIAWSNDSRKLAFLWNDAGYDFKDVFVLDLSFGLDRSPVRLTNLSLGAIPAEGDPGVSEVSFHPDGTKLLYERGETLFLATPGGETVQLASGSHGRISPDGLRLAFLRRGNLFVREIDSDGEPRLLAGDPGRRSASRASPVPTTAGASRSWKWTSDAFPCEGFPNT
jgi:dipeptidyl-peptidase 4